MRGPGVIRQISRTSLHCPSKNKTAANRSGLRLAAVVGMVPAFACCRPGSGRGCRTHVADRTASAIATDHAFERGTAGRRGRVIDGHGAFQAHLPDMVGGQTGPGYAISGHPALQQSRVTNHDINRRSGGAGRSWADRYHPTHGSCDSAACSIRCVPVSAHGACVPAADLQ